MKFRLLALALTLILAFSLAGCIPQKKSTINELNNKGPNQPVSDYALENIDVKDYQSDRFDYADVKAIPASQDYGRAELTQGYKSLTEEAQRKLYNEIMENAYYIAYSEEDGLYDVLEITLWGVELSEAQIRQVIIAFSLDNPHIFWLDNKFGYSNTTGNTVLQLYSYLNSINVERYVGKLSGEVNRMLSNLTSEMSEYDRELYVHDWILANCYYATEVTKISDDFLSFTSYGALVAGKAVCEGYTRGMQLMLASVGIESVPVIGNGNEGLHMWNGVKIDNEWYYVDTTWNDKGKVNSYDYFNITTDQLLFDHTIMPVFSQLTDEQICGTDDGEADSFNIIVPSCHAITDNYYTRNALAVNSLDENFTASLTAWLRATQSRSQNSISLLVSSELDFDETLDSLFYSGDYVFFESLDTVNSELSEDFFDRNNVSISKKPNIRVVTVYLQYTDEV